MTASGIAMVIAALVCWMIFQADAPHLKKFGVMLLLTTGLLSFNNYCSLLGVTRHFE